MYYKYHYVIIFSMNLITLMLCQLAGGPLWYKLISMFLIISQMFFLYLAVINIKS